MYDGTNVVLVFDDSSSLTNRYLHGNLVDQIFADETATEVLWSLTDNQGTVRDVANYDPTLDTSSVLNHRKFDAYGNITAESNANIDFLFAWTGRYFDVDTGLQLNGARWYDAKTARWMSIDPIHPEPDTNGYRYTWNSPTNFTDPSGLDPPDPTLETREIKAVPHPPMHGKPLVIHGKKTTWGKALGWIGGNKGDTYDVASDVVFGSSVGVLDSYGEGLSHGLLEAPFSKYVLENANPDFVPNELGYNTGHFIGDLAQQFRGGRGRRGRPHSGRLGACFVGETLVWHYYQSSQMVLGETPFDSAIIDMFSELEPFTVCVMSAGVFVAVQRRRRKPRCGGGATTSRRQFDEASSDEHSHQMWSSATDGTWRNGEPSRSMRRDQEAIAIHPGTNDDPLARMIPSNVAATTQTASSRRSLMSRLRKPLFWLLMLACLVPTELRLLRPAEVGSATRSTHSSLQTKPIREIQLGERVAGRNPVDADTDRNQPEPDPKTWRKVDFRMDRPDGERIDFSLLMPLERINRAGLEPGGSFWFEMPELGGGGLADLLRIEPCPAIAPGRGSVVTGKFVHRTASVLDLRTDAGRTIGTTANHPFWSVDRREFIQAGQLQPGETVRTLTGTARITSLTPRAGPHTVYNLQVHGEHVYHVGDDALLVHNKSNRQIRRAWEKKYKKKWPKDPATGWNQDVSHKKARADRGSDSLENIEPAPHGEHMQRHKDNDDFSRWAKRRKKKHP